MRTEGLTVGPRYKPDKDGDDSDEIIGYRASNNLKVRLTDISTAPGVIDALVKAGATDLSGPNFEFSDSGPLEKRARAKAVIVADKEAADYAAALGMRIGRILRVSERSASGDGSNDIVVTASAVLAPIQPGEQETTVTVWIDYALTK